MTLSRDTACLVLTLVASGPGHHQQPHRNAKKLTLTSREGSASTTTAAVVDSSPTRAFQHRSPKRSRPAHSAAWMLRHVHSWTCYTMHGTKTRTASLLRATSVVENNTAVPSCLTTASCKHKLAQSAHNCWSAWCEAEGCTRWLHPDLTFNDHVLVVYPPS